MREKLEDQPILAFVIVALFLVVLFITCKSGGACGSKNCQEHTGPSLIERLLD